MVDAPFGVTETGSSDGRGRGSGRVLTGGVGGDGAGVIAVSEADEAGLAPGGAPGVADLPVCRRAHMMYSETRFPADG